MMLEAPPGGATTLVDGLGASSPVIGLERPTKRATQLRSERITSYGE